MNLRRLLPHATVAPLAAVVAAGLFTAGPAPAAEPIRIGGLFASSGPAAFLGVAEDRAFRMLIEEMNKAGGIAGHPIESVIYDTEGNSTTATQQFRRLVESDKVHVVVGPSTTGESLAIKPIANELKTPIITLAGAEIVTSPTTPFVFKTPPTDRLVIQHIYGYLKAKGLMSIGFISSADGFGQAGAKIAVEEAPSFGIKLAAKEEFGPRDTDMTAQVLRIKQSGANAMVIYSVNPGPTIILRNAKAAGFAKPIINSNGAASPQLIQQAGPAAEGTMVATMRLLAPWVVEKNDPMYAVVNKLADAYKARYGEAPPTFAAHPYDALLIIEQAVKKMSGPLNREGLAKAIETVEVVGANGVYRFSPDKHNGLDESSKSLLTVAIKGGNWVLAP